VSTLAEYPSNLTWDEFLALPHELRNASLIDGEVVVNPPNAPHELVVRNLQFVLLEWICAGDDRGDVSTQQPVKINDRRGYQPDFAWYPAEVSTHPDEALPAFTGLPGLIVEVFSPSTRMFDLMRKRRDYEQIGIQEVWFVDPRLDSRGVLACQRKAPEEPFFEIQAEGDDRLTSPLLDGFEVVVARLFDRRPRWSL
jgi:Uma2 family endonuclease